MRREGHIIEEIVEYSNMAESFDQVLRGSKRKKSRQGRYLLAHREEVIKELSVRIADGSFTVANYRERTINESGKQRRIQILTMKDRIAVHAIMSVVDAHLNVRFIDLYNEYRSLASSGEKVSYIVARLASEYNVSERKVYSLIKRYKTECNSLIFGGGGNP